MMKRQVQLIAAVVLVWSFHASAENARVITFEEAIRIAMERNVDLRLAHVDAALGDVTVNEAAAQFLPDLWLDATRARNYGRSFYQAEGRTLDQTIDLTKFQVSSSVGVFNGFRDLSGLRRARSVRAAGAFDLERAEQTAVFTVAHNFIALLQSREQLRVLRENLTAEVNLEQQIKGYVDSGSREVAMLYQQQANVAAARLAVVQAQNLAQSDEVALMRTLQLDASSTYEFEASSDWSETMPEPSERASWFKSAIAQRPDLKAEEARLKAAEHDIGVSRSAFWPTVSLTAGYGSGYSSISTLSNRDELDVERQGVVALNVSIPLFDRREASNVVRRARLELMKEKIALESAREEVRLQVRQVQQDYDAAREQSEVAYEQNSAASRAVDTAVERFKAGVTTLVEVTQARARFIQAASASVDARSNLQLQRVRIEYYLGQLGAETMVAK